MAELQLSQVTEENVEGELLRFDMDIRNPLRGRIIDQKIENFSIIDEFGNDRPRIERVAQLNALMIGLQNSIDALLELDPFGRSEESSVGKEGVHTDRSRLSPVH